MTILFVTALMAGLGGSPEAAPRFCSDTAAALFEACGAEVRDDFSKARAICINISDAEDREECQDDAAAARDEGNERCAAQRTARRQVCARLGEARYDPSFDPADFEDDFRDLDHPNRYFPLRIGNRWEYRSATETVVTEILD